jgi:transcriptional antiterminator RfaH
VTEIRSPALRWYVAQTHAHAENKAAEHLVRQGYLVYLPRYRKRRRHARRVDEVAAPLFPRYLFIAANVAAQRWRAIQSTVGIARLVCNGDAPAAVGGDVVDALRAREDERGLIRLNTTPAFVPGDSIRILDGAFAACLGLFECMTDGERVAILLDLLGRKVRVILNVDCVAAV